MLVFLPGTLREPDATDFSGAEPSPPSPLPIGSVVTKASDCWGTHTRAPDPQPPSFCLLAHPEPGYLSLWAERCNDSRDVPLKQRAYLALGPGSLG